jgi:hypothetical protein
MRIWERWRARGIARRSGLPEDVVLRWLRREQLTDEDARLLLEELLVRVIEKGTGMTAEQLQQRKRDDA